jgi:hypothetical protein
VRLPIWMVLSMVAGTAFAMSEADPFDGTWRFDRSQSHYESGDPPREMTIIIATDGARVHYRSHAVERDGRSSDCEYQADYDGIPVTVSGSSGLMLPVALTRFGPRIVDATYMRAFRVVASSRREIDQTGAVMTVTTQSKDALGRALTNIGVYRRVAVGGDTRVRGHR